MEGRNVARKRILLVEDNKSHDALKHIPVVAVTSHAMADDERRARAAGCDDYLSKPVDEDELMAKIRKLI